MKQARRGWLSALLAAAVGVLLCSGCPGLRIRQAQDQVRIVEDLPYVRGSQDPKQRLDLYLPKTLRDFPMVLFVHGGFWRNQDRRYYQAFTGLHGNVGVALAKRGFGVAVASYRLLPSASLADQLADVVAAAQFAVDHAQEYGGNPRKLVLAGFSAGGHLIMSLCVDPERLKQVSAQPSVVRGCVSVSGVLDIAAMAAGQDAEFNKEVTDRHFGTAREGLPRFSPIQQFSAQMPLPLILWAERDYPFVKQAGHSAVDKIKSLGLTPHAKELAGHDHADMVLRINSKEDQVTESVVEFLTSVMNQP